jgi:hypothetical protein
MVSLPRAEEAGIGLVARPVPARVHVPVPARTANAIGFRTDHAGLDEAVALHRYFDASFVERFLADLQAWRLTLPAARAFLRDDALGDHGDDLPSLRLPLHRSFYLASCAVGCGPHAAIPLDPRSVVEAGFVIRRLRADGGEQCWRIHDGVASGWEDLTAGDADPDHRRWHGRTPSPQAPFDGEQVHPMHPVRLPPRAGEPPQRAQVVLYGFVPVGSGTTGAIGTRTAPTSEDSAALAGAALRELPWPFGHQDTVPLWQDADGRLVVERRPSDPFARTLTLVALRYRIGIEDGPTEDGRAIAALFDELGFTARRMVLDHSGWFEAEQRTLPWSEWLAAVGAEAFADWVRTEARRADGAPVQDLPFPGFGGDWHIDLVVGEDWTRRLRQSQVAAHAELHDRLHRDVALPRFADEAGDVYVLRPFARVRCGGCTCLHWSPHRSRRFRVASPYDGRLGRPSRIPLPKLRHLRALPQAHFIADNALARILGGIRPDGMEVKQRGFDAGALCWMFSFSIPAITLCAMIILMVMISVLDFIFRWIPFIFLRLPVLCKPPKGTP